MHIILSKHVFSYVVGYTVVRILPCYGYYPTLFRWFELGCLIVNAVHYSLLFRETKLFKEFKETVWNYEEWAMRWAGFLNAVFTTHSFKMCVKPVFS